MEVKLTKQIYKTILQEDLAATIKEFKINPENLIFQHEDDSKHKAKKVK